MGDSVSFYNWDFSIMNSKIQDFWNTKIVKGYAKIIPSNLVKEYSINAPIGKSLDLIPNWDKTRKMY